MRKRCPVTCHDCEGMSAEIKSRVEEDLSSEKTHGGCVEGTTTC